MPDVSLFPGRAQSRARTKERLLVSSPAMQALARTSRLLGVLLASASAARAAKPLELAASANANVQEWTAGRDYLVTSRWNPAYLKFDLSRAPARIRSATLQLALGKLEDNALTFTLSACDDAWDESGKVLPEPGPRLLEIPSADAEALEIDVTAYVAAQRAGDAVASFVLSHHGDRWQSLFSRTHSGQAPVLVITPAD